MSSYDFILDNLHFSYSSASTYETCPHAYRLSYIDGKPRENNFYAQYGLLIHKCLEEFFTKRLDTFELSSFYLENYDKTITMKAYGAGADLESRYKREGLDFFNDFWFPLDDYEVETVEAEIKFEIKEGIKVVARPDLVLFRKLDKRSILLDYKTAAPYRKTPDGKEKVDYDKVNGYMKQMYLYTYALRNYSFFPIDEISIWYPRLSKVVTTEWKMEAEEKAVTSLLTTIQKIKEDEEFHYNNSNSFFCNNLCGVRKYCEYR